LALNANAGRNSGSAKGAILTNSLGQRPRISDRIKPAALKARFIPAPVAVEGTANRPVESRQNLAAASLNENAPLALNANAGRQQDRS
jgi:hypothetical protein